MKRFNSTMILALLVSMAAWAQSSTNWVPIYKWSGSSISCPDQSVRNDLAKKAEKGDVSAQDALGSLDLSTCTGENDPAKGIELLQRAAAKGSVHAQLVLGAAYREGKSVPKDVKIAISWFEKAADTGDARARNDLGIFYLGNGAVKDESRAAKDFLFAAEHDLPEAEYNVATMYDEGHGVEQSYELARKWYLKASEHRDAAAEYRLGMLCEQGLGGGINQADAMRWFKQAADHGSEDAQVRLGLKSASQSLSLESGYFQYSIGLAMLNGKGVTKDETKAAGFLKKSAELGYPPAMVELGQLFASGRGVAKDEAKAVDYYQQAITRDAKYALAYNELAWVYVTSEDAKRRNPLRALEYATRAVELSEGKDSAFLDTLAHAYFQSGDINKSVEIETKAAALAPKDDFIQKTLLEYKNAAPKH